MFHGTEGQMEVNAERFYPLTLNIIRDTHDAHTNRAPLYEKFKIQRSIFSYPKELLYRDCKTVIINNLTAVEVDIKPVFKKA